MQPRTTIWDLEPHTAAKHEILRRYLQAWVPILSQGRFPLLVFIDAFAGPGRYSKGEEGSPIIALRAVTEQRQPITAKVDFHFIELDRSRAGHLAAEIDALHLPTNLRSEIHGGRSFQDAFPDIWERYASAMNGRRAPTFVFVDPFGFSQVPFAYVTKVLGAKSCEVLITFMYEEINRFLAQDKQPANFDELFGCPDWRQGIELTDPQERLKFLHDLYQHQLKAAAGGEFVRSFGMRNDRSAMDYFLFFGTNNELGLRRMKESMWRIDQSGTYTFSDATDPNQHVLFAAEPDRNLLKKLIVDRFSGREATRDEIETFVVRETPFRETHYKKVLETLEIDGQVSVTNAPPTRRRGKFADGALRLAFKRKA